MTGKTQTIVTVGASEALDLAFRAVIEPGDGFVPAPSLCFGVYAGVAFAGRVAVPIRSKGMRRFYGYSPRR